METTTKTATTYKVLVRVSPTSQVTLVDTESLELANSIFDTAIKTSPKTTVALEDNTRKVIRLKYATD